MMETEIAVVGAGPAGLSAALEASLAGAKVTIIDEYIRPGGQYFKQPPAAFKLLDRSAMGRDYDRGLELMKRVEQGKIELLSDTLVWGALESGVLEIYGRGECERLKAQRIIVATGAYDRPMAFPGWTLPGVITAGYVDKPASDLVVRLLELARLPLSGLGQAGRVRPWLGVTDARLFRELLQPGERSAVFKIQSPSADRFKGDLAVHFFYLNVGRTDHPWVVRVEIPAWVADHPASVALLHATVVYQSRLLGARPYPYALHRAHEVAVVTLAEKDQLEEMMIAEMIGRGLPPGEKSYKQNAKDLQGRTKHKP